MRRGAVFAVLLLALLPAGPAGATQAGQDALKGWKLMDDCARKAQAAFPDYTAASNAKREAKLNRCLAEKNLPPRAPLPPR